MARAHQKSPDTGKKDEREISALVTETLPNAMFRVDAEGGKQLLAYLSGKMRLHRIKVLIGDTVRIVPDEYGQRARIVRRT